MTMGSNKNQTKPLWKKYGNFRAVVLAAGQGSRLPELTNSVPKFLLPVGGVPLIWYPLDLLSRSGFQDAIVIVRESNKSAIEAALADGKAPLKVTFMAIPDTEDLGTADSIRHLEIEWNLVVVSGDLIVAPEVTLADLIVTHMENRAALTVLLSPLPQPLPADELPGFKQKPSYERDRFGVEEATGQLLFLHPAGTTADLVIEEHIFRDRTIALINDSMDCHAYVLSSYAVENNIHNSMVSSLRTDLLPLMLKLQFRSTPVPDEDPQLTQILNKFHTSLAEIAPVRPLCYAARLSSPSLPSLRVNTLLAYIQANRLAPARFATRLPTDAFQVKVAPGGITSSGVKRTKKCTISASILGMNCEVGDKARVIRSVLMPGSVVEEGAKVTDSVLLPGARVGANATITACIVAQTVAPSAKYQHVVVDASAQMLDHDDDDEQDDEEE